MTVYVDEFEDDDVIFFTTDTGISINIEKARFLVFRNTMKGWIARAFHTSDVNSFSEKIGVAAEYTAAQEHGRGLASAASNIGAGVGTAFMNSREKTKAKKETGVTIRLRSTDLPRFFLNVPDSNERDSLLEAMRQALRDGEIDELYGDVPDVVRTAFRRPSEAEVKQAADQHEKALQAQTEDVSEFVKYRSDLSDESEPKGGMLKMISIALVILILGSTLLVAIF